MEYGIAKLIYFDPDIRVLRNLSSVFSLLDESSIALTPHLTAPLIDDGAVPSEITILRAGTYNLGFIAIANTITTHAMLDWWQERLYDKCRMAQDEGMCVDQKWIDLVPLYFDQVVIIRAPGYNVAYWNLPTRRVARAGSEVSVNGEPGYFFHFSGYNAEEPQRVSKHDTRLSMEALGQAADLFVEYADALVAHGVRTVAPWPYAYGFFDNGVDAGLQVHHRAARLCATSTRCFLQ